MRLRTTAIALIVVTSMVGAAVAPAAGQQAEGEAYSGTYVEFDATNAAVADYSVGNDVVVENVTMQSSSEARSSSDFEAGLEAATDVQAAGLDLSTNTDVKAVLQSDSGGEIEAHDNNHGVLQFRASDEAQVVNAELSGDAEAESGSDGRVVVTKDDGSQGTFLVVGDGEAVVNEDGNVTAEVEQGSQLVYRQYTDGERDDSDEEAERMIQDGTATAEVYVQQSNEAGSEGEAAAASVVQYGQDTTVDVTSRSQNEVNMTVERTESQGKVVLTTLAEESFGTAENAEVFVDGEAAAEAESYGAVAQSAENGDEPRYYATQSSSAEAATDVAVGVDHFSERNVRMESEGGGGGIADGAGAGFGALVALSALAALAAALFASRRRL